MPSFKLTQMEVRAHARNIYIYFFLDAVVCLAGVSPSSMMYTSEQSVLRWLLQWQVHAPNNEPAAARSGARLLGMGSAYLTGMGFALLKGMDSARLTGLDPA